MLANTYWLIKVVKRNAIQGTGADREETGRDSE